MIEFTDTELADWLAGVVSPQRVTLGPPRDASDDDAGVDCHLLALVPTPMPRGTRRPPIQAIARYLVTTRAPDPVDAHRLLGQVLVATADRADLDLEHDEPPVALWQALGVPPRPALVLRAPVRWARAEPRAALVREPLRVEWDDARALRGVVVSPAGTPVARAEVRLPGVDAPAWTERDGSFVIPGVPASARDLVLTVTGRGLVRTIPVAVPIAVPSGSAAALTVVFDPLHPSDPE